MKNGFTLVELLAVIVILAVLALIATPVVLSIIDDTKESAMLRSAEMYLSGVENAVMRENMNSGGNFRPNDCTISNGNMTCGTTNVEVEVDGEVPSTGAIVFENGKIKEVELIYESGTIIKDDSGNLVYSGKENGSGNQAEKTLATICTYQNNGVAEKTAGSKYSCEVKPGVSYNFYVLTTPKETDTTINLIMDRNIYYDATAGTGSVADATNKGLVAWQTSGANADGPVTAMDYLYNATKDWTNIPNIEMNYTDEGNTGDYGYGTIVTTDNITKITKKDGTAVTVLTDQEGYSNLKARMPYKSEVSAYDSTNKTNAYLYDYLNQSGTIQTNAISGINGYWTLSSGADRSSDAWFVNYYGYVNFDLVVIDGFNGVRAVINLKI